MTTQREPEETVQAAGCVLWRHAPNGGGLELAVVHRPRYDDWSHPKGKLKPGEGPLEAALREVREETGMGCTPGAPLPSSHYEAHGRPKEVRYWAAQADPDAAFVPNDEVDRLLWLAPEQARQQLTQERDRFLVDALLGVVRLP